MASVIVWSGCGSRLEMLQCGGDGCVGVILWLSSCWVGVDGSGVVSGGLSVDVVGAWCVWRWVE
eukprot:8133399-Alexandrium_andersonii.AAC.1